MNFVHQAIAYLLTGHNWTGPVGLGARLAEHLEYTAIAVGAAALVAVPLGLIIGHTRRGTLLVVGAVNALNPERILLLPDGVEDHWSPDYADLVSLA